MTSQIWLKPLAVVGALTLFAGVSTATVLGVKDARDPRQPDAYDHMLFNQCVGTAQLFTYELKNGDVETLYDPDARQCGGDGTGDFVIIQEGKGIVAGSGIE